MEDLFRLLKEAAKAMQGALEKSGACLVITVEPMEDGGFKYKNFPVCILPIEDLQVILADHAFVQMARKAEAYLKNLITPAGPTN